MSQRRNDWLARFAESCSAVAERYFPDALVFAMVAVIVVALAAFINGATVTVLSEQFVNGFWGLIPFTMQMSFVIIGGYLTADSPPVARLVDRLAALPRTGRGALIAVALTSLLLSLIHWGLGLIVPSLLARALARREELHMDYRAAGAAAYLGTGATWALGMSSSAAQLQANPASLPTALLRITGVIPFRETILTWQSLLIVAVLSVISIAIVWLTAPSASAARTANQYGAVLDQRREPLAPRQRPGEWLEYAPYLSVLLFALGAFGVGSQVLRLGIVGALANLNTYNLIFVLLGLLLQWRPRRFLEAVRRSVPAAAGVLIQFPFYGAIAALLNNAGNAHGRTLTATMSDAMARTLSVHSFPLVVGGYSAVLGFFVPSGGGKWLIEAPYVMRTAALLHYPLGWTVQIYNAAEALPNLINPFWMLPIIGLLGLKARDIVGFTFVQLLVHLPVVLLLLWLLGMTIPFHAAIVPAASG